MGKCREYDDVLPMINKATYRDNTFSPVGSAIAIRVAYCDTDWI
jgi:hypothetical protein